jgi:putative transposase
VTPRIISDNGPQFVARDFKEFIRLCGIAHVRTSPYYPQSNGKVEGWHKTVKRECIRPLTPLCLEDARRIGADFVHEYNIIRLHSGIGYVTPLARLEGRDQQIMAERRRKLPAASQAREMAHDQLCQPQPEHQTAVLVVA